MSWFNFSRELRAKRVTATRRYPIWNARGFLGCVATRWFLCTVFKSARLVVRNWVKVSSACRNASEMPEFIRISYCSNDKKNYVDPTRLLSPVIHDFLVWMIFISNKISASCAYFHVLFPFGNVIFYANERSISGQCRFSLLVSIVQRALAFSLLPLWNGAGHEHVRDTFDRRNSISSAVGLNNNTLKDRSYRRVLYRARNDFYVIFFLPISHRRRSRRK